MLPGFILTGVAMGLASSLHCAGMCGPIACGLLLAGGRGGGAASQLLQVLAAQAVRITSYMVAGAAFGVFGAGLFGIVNWQSAHALMQWAAALTIIWMGLSVAGAVPAMVGLDRLLVPLAGRVAGLGGAGGRLVPAGFPRLAVGGLVWGAMPCAMVYAALMNALLTGTISGGIALMAGFGLGTVPAVTVAALGLTRLSRVTASPRGRAAAGAGLVAAGIAGLILTAPGGPLCLT